MTDKFASSSDTEWWNSVYDSYPTVLKMKAEKLNPTKRKDLIKLDKWFQDELPKTISGRDEKYVTHDELCQVMKWKLTTDVGHVMTVCDIALYMAGELMCKWLGGGSHIERYVTNRHYVTKRGKFRPRLNELAASNAEADVVSASKTAFKKLPNVSAAINSLTVLKGIGPATASAVLAAGSPDRIAFMADESMLALPDMKPLEYTLKFCLRYHELIKDIVRRLNEKDPEKSWSHHKVEITLWTYYLGNQYQPAMFDDKAKSEKRKGDNKDEKGTKKIKTK